MQSYQTITSTINPMPDCFLTALKIHIYDVLKQQVYDHLTYNYVPFLLFLAQQSTFSLSFFNLVLSEIVFLKITHCVRLFIIPSPISPFSDRIFHISSIAQSFDWKIVIFLTQFLLCKALLSNPYTTFANHLSHTRFWSPFNSVLAALGMCYKTERAQGAQVLCCRQAETVIL